MFEPLNDLEKALTKAAADSSYRPQFYRDLLVSDIFIVNGEDTLDVHNGVMTKGAKIKLQYILSDGISWLPVFSSLRRLQEFINGPGSFIQLNTKDLLDMTRGANVVLNPNCEYGKEFTPKEIE